MTGSAPATELARSLKGVALLNLIDDSLSSLARKGNLSYAYELYNPGEAFGAVHHVSFYNEDRGLAQARPWLHVHVVRRTPRSLRGVGRLLDVMLGVLQIWWIARHHRVRVVRGRGPLFASALGVVVARLRGIPSVVSIGGDHRLAWRLMGRYPVFNSRRLTEGLERWVLRHADEVWCPNEHSRCYAMALGVSSERAVVIPWRLKADVFQAFTTAVPPPAGGPIILFVGRLERDKQPHVVLEALPTILSRHPESRPVFVGDGPLREELVRRAAALGIAERVAWVGFQPTEVVKSWLASAAVVCVPMSGFVIFEAAAFAAPIVACDIEWQREFVVDGETGVLVPNADSAALADAVVSLLDDRAWAQRLGAEARRRLHAHYAPCTITARELERLARVTAGPRPSKSR